MVGIPEVPKSRKRKNKLSISFAEEEDIINMEDVDPSIGKFRNMVSTTIIPNKVSMCFREIFHWLAFNSIVC